MKIDVLGSDVAGISSLLVIDFARRCASVWWHQTWYHPVAVVPSGNNGNEHGE